MLAAPLGAGAALAADTAAGLIDTVNGIARRYGPILAGTLPGAGPAIRAVQRQAGIDPAGQSRPTTSAIRSGHRSRTPRRH